MEKKQRRSFKSLLIIATALLIVIAVVVIVSVANGSSKTSYAGSDPTPQVAEGTSYITQMESVATAPIEEKILAEEQAKLDEERLQEMLSDPAKIFSAFQEYNIVLVGESRTSGFSAYGFLDENHVLGGIGWSIMEIPALYDTIASLKPSHIIFCFGIVPITVYFPLSLSAMQHL